MQGGRIVYTVEVDNNGRREVIDFEGPDGLTDAQITQLADTHLRTARPGQEFPPSIFGGDQRVGQAEAAVNPPPSEALAAAIGPVTALAPGNIVDQAAGAAQGAGRVFDNAAELAQGAYNQTLGRVFGQSDSATQANAQGQGFEALADQLGEGSGLGNTLGQIGASAFLTRRVPTAFGQGAASGALMSEADTAGGVAMDAVTGGIGGHIGDRAVRGIAGLVAPVVDDAARMLHQRGVRMTPGQASPTIQRWEERRTSRPFLGDQIIEGRQRSYRDFNRAAAEEVIAPYNAVGPQPVRIPRGSTGTVMVRSVGDQLSHRYDQLIPNLRMVPDQQLATDISALQTTLTNGELSPAALRQFETIVRNQVMPRLRPGGLDGPAYRQIERNIGRQIRRYGRSSEPDHQAMANAFEELQGAFQGALQRSNPRYAGELRALNDSWANLVRLEDAAGASRGGYFSPLQFRQAVRRGDDSVRRRAMARGEARMQDLAEAGSDVLPSEYPDSGTAGRQQDNIFDPRFTMGYLQSRVYTPDVQNALAGLLLAPRPPAAQSIADLLRGLPAPVAGAAGLNAITSPLLGTVPSTGQ